VPASRARIRTILIVGLIGARAHGSADTGAVVIAPERDGRRAYRFTEFVEDVAGEHGRGNKTQGKGLGVHPGTGHDSGGELLVLVVAAEMYPRLAPTREYFPARRFANSKRPSSLVIMKIWFWGF